MTKSKLRERVGKWTAPNLDFNSSYTYNRSWEEIQEMPSGERTTPVSSYARKTSVQRQADLH